MMLPLDSFACGYLVFPTPFVEETILSPLYSLSALVKDQLTIYARVYFWTLYFVPLVYMSVFMPVLHCFDYCSFVICFEIRKCEAPALFFFLKIVLAI